MQINTIVMAGLAVLMLSSCGSSDSDSGAGDEAGNPNSGDGLVSEVIYGVRSDGAPFCENEDEKSEGADVVICTWYCGVNSITDKPERDETGEWVITFSAGADGEFAIELEEYEEECR